MSPTIPAHVRELRDAQKKMAMTAFNQQHRSFESAIPLAAVP
jgi:hypothetical protein